MNVAELAATLGWDVDFATIAKYQSELNKAREATQKLEDDTKKLANAEKLAAELRGRGITGPDPARALALISPGAPGARSADGGAADKAAGSSIKWGRALEVANAGLGVAMKGYAIVTSAAGRLRGVIDGATQSAERYNVTAARLGISVEAVQELGYAASQSDTDLDTLVAGLSKFADRADAAKKGGKDAAASLRAVGVSAADLRSGKLSLDGALGSIADKFAAMPDGAKKSALAVDLFGQSGRALIPLLNQGSKGVGALRAEAQELGIVMSGETTEGLAALGDQQSKLNDQLSGIKNQVIAALVPMLTELAAGLSAWLTENRETIVEVLTVVGKGIVYIIQGIGYAVRGIAAAVEWVIENWQLVVAVIASILWPLTLIVAGIMAVVYAFPYIVDAAEATAEAVSDAFSAAGRAIAAAFRAVVRAFGAAWDAIKSAARSVVSFFEAIGRAIKSAFATVVNFFIDGINDAIALLNKAIRLANKIPGVNIGTADSVERIGGNPRTAANAPGAGGTTVTNSIAGITVYAAPGQSEQQVAINVRREMATVLREAATGVA